MPPRYVRLLSICASGSVIGGLAVMAQSQQRGSYQPLEEEPTSSAIGRARSDRSQPKIEAGVWDAARLKDAVPVFIRLRDQPQHQIIERLRAANELRRQVVEGRYQKVADRLAVSPEDLEKAHVEVDEMEMEFRRTIISEVSVVLTPIQDDFQAQLQSVGAKNIRRYLLINLFAAEVTEAALSALDQNPSVASISLVRTLESQTNISVPSFGAGAFWYNTTPYTGAGQSVAILDSGINPHPAFGNRLISKKFLSGNFLNCLLGDDFSNVYDNDGHGSHVAGIAASADLIYRGVAFGVSTIYNAKIGCRTNQSLAPFFQSFFSQVDVLTAIQSIYLETPARVLNLSSGRPFADEDSAFDQDVDHLLASTGLTLVVSAGNKGPVISIGSPAVAWNVISVAAMNTFGTPSRSDDTIADYSSRGPTRLGRKKPDLAAPGSWFEQQGIMSTSRTGSFISMPGTSMAAPHITGAAVLLRSAGVSNQLGIKALLLNTTDTLGWSNGWGWGHANLYRTIEQPVRVKHFETPGIRI